MCRVLGNVDSVKIQYDDLHAHLEVGSYTNAYISVTMYHIHVTYYNYVVHIPPFLASMC